MKKKMSRSRKGVASIFMAIYLALTVLVLGISLFSAHQIYNTSTVERLKIEQEKEQEAILLQVGSITLTEDFIDTITVNNTGSITVRIRGIYIDSALILDPSTMGNTYINPQESLSMKIYGNADVSYTDNKFSILTITTERGTSFSEIIENLFPKTKGGETTDTIYGPIRLIFEEFHWTYYSSGFDLNFLRSATWREGWKAPPKDEIIWRVRIQNVDRDGRIIKLGNCSCLTLVSNEVGSRYTFYIDTESSDLTLRPKETPSPVYFVWQKAGTTTNPTETPQGTGPGSSRTCITFLLFEGQIGSVPLGETIPFEAVFVSGD